MKKYTSSEKQLIRNCINLRKSKGQQPIPRLNAFIENDIEFIKAFDAKADIFNKRAKKEGWPLTVSFNEQIDWDIKAFREIDEIRNFEL